MVVRSIGRRYVARSYFPWSGCILPTASGPYVLLACCACSKIQVRSRATSTSTPTRTIAARLLSPGPRKYRCTDEVQWYGWLNRRSQLRCHEAIKQATGKHTPIQDWKMNMQPLNPHAHLTLDPRGLRLIYPERMLVSQNMRTYFHTYVYHITVYMTCRMCTCIHLQTYVPSYL